MYCAICCHAISRDRDKVVLTKDGLYVHVCCADREASEAWALRLAYALLHIGLVIAAALALLLLAASPEAAVLVSVLGMVSHGVIHRRWWLYLTLHVRLLCCGYLPGRKG
jgi:hypothetical protein